MAFAYVLDPCLQHQNRAGVNNVHGYFKVYLAGTDDLAETYSDFGGSLNPENIEIDNNGRCVIIADSSHPYRVEMYLPNGDLVYTQEPVWTLASGGGASIIDIESTDASVQIDKTTVGGKVTYDLSVNEDDPNRLDWIKCLGAQLVDGIYVPQKSAGTLNMGEKGISLEAEMYYHATVRVKATKNQQRLPYYDEVNVVLGLWDGETTTTIGTYKRIVDYSLGLSQEFEVGADVKVGNLNSQLVISIAGQDHQGGDFEIPEVDLHRVYSGVPRLPAGVATRAWVNENFQKKLVPGENITIDPVTNEISADLPEQEQSDWAEDDSSKPDYIKNKPNLAAVATSGSYDDLSDKPSIPDPQVQSDWSEADSSKPDYIKNKPNLASVATSGSYNDLSDKPSIPDAQVQSDWNEADSSKVDYIKNKPNLATVATSGSYNDLSDKPSIPPGVVVDQHYDPTSEDAQSGTAVKEALDAYQALPASTAQDAGKVLRVDTKGDPEWAAGGGGEVNVIEGVQMPDSQSRLTPDANKTVHIPYAQPSSELSDGVAGVITGAEKAKLNSLSGWLAGIVLGSDAYPFNPADGLEFAGGDGIGITLDDSDEIPKLKYEALYAAGLEMTNESHKRLRVRLGRGLQFDSTAGIEIKLGKGLQFNESAGVDANALEIEGYEGIENVVETVEKLARDLDTQITANFDFPNISGVSDFASTSVSTLNNGACMLCQAFTIPINHDIRTISDDAGSHTLLGIFAKQLYTQAKIMLALYEYSYPEGDAEHGSTTYVGDTGPVDVVAGINEYPLRNRNPQITELRSDRVYYATLYVPNSVHGTSNLSLASIPGYGANNFLNAEPRFSCAVENITYGGHELDMNDPTTTLNHYTAEPSEDPDVPYLNYAIGPWNSQYNERPTAPRFYLQIRNGKRTMPEPSNDPFVDLGDPSLKASATYRRIFPNPGFTIGQQSIVFQEVQPSLACTITEWTIYDNNPTDSLGWGGLVYDGGFENQLCSNSNVTLTELGETSSGSGIYGHKYTHNNGGLQLAANTTYRFVASCQASSSGSTKIVQYDGTSSKKDLRMAESGYNISQWVTIAQATQVDGTYLKVKTSDNREYVI